MLSILNDWLWGKGLIVVLIAIGLIITVRSRFVQFRYFGRMFGILGQAFHHEADQISAFQALTLSVAGRVGAGNIAGVAIALSLGGPGAIFWMWLMGVMGMATSIFECSLAQLFKITEPDGTYRGGPSYYIERGLGQRWLAILFSILLLVTFGLGFNALQSYTVAVSIHDSFGIPAYITGLILTGVINLTIFGGVKRITTMAEYVVPMMAIAYFGLTLFILAHHLGDIPAILTLIIKSAFGLEPAMGAGMGMAVLLGVKRGLFSNEAGLGSAPNVAAIATVRHPVAQGIVQALSVFIDTIVLCSCTAMIILVSGVDLQGRIGGIALTQVAVSQQVGPWGEGFVAIALTLFAFTSIVYNYYLGENSLNFFSDSNQALFNGFRILTVALVFWGTVQDLNTVFSFADIAMGLLAVVNLVAIAQLFPTGVALIQDYDHCIQIGQSDPLFDPTRFQQKNTEIILDAQAWPSLDRDNEPVDTVEEAPIHAA